MTTLREKLIKIGAKVVRHGRYVTFQLAEVAIPRDLFAEILRLIGRLRPAPLRHDGSRSKRFRTSRRGSYVSRGSKCALPSRDWRRTGRSVAKSARQTKEVVMQCPDNYRNGLQQPVWLPFSANGRCYPGNSG